MLNFLCDGYAKGDYVIGKLCSLTKKGIKDKYAGTFYVKKFVCLENLFFLNHTFNFPVTMVVNNIIFEFEIKFNFFSLP